MTGYDPLLTVDFLRSGHCGATERDWRINPAAKKSERFVGAAQFGG
jgi:hypothetical protein